MINYVEGNLLDSLAVALVNTVGMKGKGLHCNSKRLSNIILRFIKKPMLIERLALEKFWRSQTAIY